MFRVTCRNDAALTTKLCPKTIRFQKHSEVLVDGGTDKSHNGDFVVTFSELIAHDFVPLAGICNETFNNTLISVCLCLCRAYIEYTLWSMFVCLHLLLGVFKRDIYAKDLFGFSCFLYSSMCFDLFPCFLYSCGPAFNVMFNVTCSSAITSHCLLFPL